MMTRHLWRLFRSSQFGSGTRYLHLIGPEPVSKSWTSNELRQTFSDYFQRNDHEFVASSSVVPKHDQSLLFVNAGMNQFKPIFLNDSKAIESHGLSGLKKVVNWQKCIRLSGKHNDFEEVGKNFRHHTFFEMLGNWAFRNAYFKVNFAVFP
jgi:alanyl-tRNA synthetase